MKNTNQNEPMDQITASMKVLEDSQNETFPFRINEFGLNIEVQENVFSPKYFNGWRVFIKNFPSVNGEKVLEIGPGHGAISCFLAKNGAERVVAIDINPFAVSNTRANILLNKITNMEVREGDIFSPLDENEKFDSIFWNTPFMFVPENYEYGSLLERGLFDPGYKLIERFLEEGKKYLTENGRILFGTGNFGDVPLFMELARKHRYSIKLIAKEDTTEINPVDFQLYELKVEK